MKKCIQIIECLSFTQPRLSKQTAESILSNRRHERLQRRPKTSSSQGRCHVFYGEKTLIFVSVDRLYLPYQISVKRFVITFQLIEFTAETIF